VSAMKRLEEKVALITGAAQGIGRGIALCMAEEGADVVINELEHLEAAAEVAKSIEAMGRQALVWQADAADREQIRNMVEKAVQHFGHLDIAVANAAHSVRQPIAEADWAGVERTLAVSQLGVFHLCQFASQQMVARGQGGKIILIGSIHSEIPFAQSGPYNMAKAAINHLARTLANELAGDRINVNVINPGWIDTPGERRFASEAEIQGAARVLPWRRLGTPQDIGKAAVFLASDDADYITGASLRVDGGLAGSLTLAKE
jgi:glucose 1-dehydrogenase